MCLRAVWHSLFDFPAIWNEIMHLTGFQLCHKWQVSGQPLWRKMFGILRLIGFASAAGFSILEELRSSYGWEFNSLSALPESEMRDMLNRNALYLPFLGPVLPLLYYIGIGMMEDLAALPDQQLGKKLPDR